MPKSLHKVTKQIAKKRGHKASAIHEFSRDSRRLQRAGLRDEKLIRLASSRNKANQPHLQRIHHFQLLAQSLDDDDASTPFTESSFHAAIASFIHRDDDELASLQASRRPGRPPTPREELVKQRVAAEEKEFDGGFYCPDMLDAATVGKLRGWDGEWVSCNAMKFVRVMRAGETRESVWPPKGLS
ncbi:translation machinery-associated protein 16 [Neofusicoccum ribis]|uniref:Translation machinery-associated protein 16 n=1 Tax=Neofusicoccum ribis TaxID=45134 RepID=A0ABR3SJ83_9PEZI